MIIQFITIRKFYKTKANSMQTSSDLVQHEILYMKKIFSCKVYLISLNVT